MMSASPIYLSLRGQHRGSRCVAESNEQRVVDFYRSMSPCFFGVIVSTCSSANGGSESEAAPALVTVVGELDVSTAPLLRDCFARIHGDIEVDCSGLEFVDARGLAILVSARARCEPHGRFVLVNPARCLSRVLRITGLDATFEIRYDAALVR